MVKPVIYKRNEKGSALTFTEVDTSLQNLRDSTISIAVTDSDTIVNDLNDTTTLVALDGISIIAESSSQTISFDAAVVNDTTPQLGGDLDVNGHSIVSTSNGNIELAPDGTGKVIISGDLQVDGTTTTINSTTVDIDDINITIAKGSPNAAASDGGGITLEGPTTAATITYTSSDDSWNINKRLSLGGDLHVTGNSTGLYLEDLEDVDTTGATLGQALVYNSITGVWQPETITTDLIADTTPQLGGNLDVNGYSIVSASNGNIVLDPNGTGNIQLNADTVYLGDGSGTVSLTTNSSQTLFLRTLSDPTSIQLGSTVNLYGDTQIVNGGLNFFSSATTVDLTTQTSSTNIRISTNLGTGGQILLNAGTNGNIQILPTGTGRTIIDNCEPELIDYAETVYSIGNSGSGTVTPDINNGNVQTITATGNFTLALPSNIKTGSSLTLIITQDATGSRTCTFNASYKFAGGTKTLSTAANSIDIVSIFYDGSRYLASLGTNFS